LLCAAVGRGCRGSTRPKLGWNSTFRFRALLEPSLSLLILGDSDRALFWNDRWLNGVRVTYYAPNLLALVWLVSRNRCWTADRLQRRDLPASASCPLCSQKPETIQHLLLGCVVAREVWTWALSRGVKLGWLPAADADLVSWWTSRPGQGASQQDMYLFGHQAKTMFSLFLSGHQAKTMVSLYLSGHQAKTMFSRYLSPSVWDLFGRSLFLFFLR
jgi:hypothetical protein